VQIDYRPVFRFHSRNSLAIIDPSPLWDFSPLKFCVSSLRGSHSAQEAGPLRGSTVGFFFRSGRGDLRESTEVGSGARSHLSALSSDPPCRAELYAVPTHIFGIPIVWVKFKLWRPEVGDQLGGVERCLVQQLAGGEHAKKRRVPYPWQV
jgi:hypothetical protein